MPDSTQEKSYLVTALSGVVEVLSAETGAPPINLKVGDFLVPGSKITVHDNSQLVVTDSSGNSLTIPADTVFVVPSADTPVDPELLSRSNEDLIAETAPDEDSFRSNPVIIEREDSGGLAPSQPSPYQGSQQPFSSNSPISLPELDLYSSGTTFRASISSIQTSSLLTEPKHGIDFNADTTIALRDSVNTSFGQTLVQQSGVLSNDEGTGITVTAVNGIALPRNGQSVIQGEYGTLTINADGTYIYDNSHFDLNSDLVAHWSFSSATVDTSEVMDNSATDRISDAALLHHNADIVSGGVSGNALALDGTGDHASVSTSAELGRPADGVTEARTVSLHFRPASATSMAERQILYTEGDESGGFVIYIQNSTLYAGAHNGTDWAGEFFSTSLSETDIADWHNVTLSFDGNSGSMEAWLNGSSFGTSSSAQTISVGSGQLRLGGIRNDQIFHDGTQSGSFGFEGQIDEVRIYSRALNQQEVNGLSQASDSLSEVFQYTIENIEGQASTSSLTINLTPPDNHAPITNDDSLTVTLGSNWSTVSLEHEGLLGNDFDADGDSLTLVQVDGTAVADEGATRIEGDFGVLLVGANGTYAYAPSNGAGSGTDTFSYTVSDGTTTRTANLTVTVLPDGQANADLLYVTESALPAGSVYVVDSRLDSDGDRDYIGYLTVLDTTTGASIRLGEITGVQRSATLNIARAPDGTLYAIDNTSLYTIDTSTMQATLVGTHDTSGGSLQGITVAPDGTIYAASFDSSIYRIDPQTGAGTLLGNVPGYQYINSGLAWHDGALYTVALNPGTPHLVRIEPSGSSITVTPAPNDYNGPIPGGIVSVQGELLGITGSLASGSIATIDTATGYGAEAAPAAAVALSGSTASTSDTRSGNLLTNDDGTQTVTTITLPDGTSHSVGNSGAVLQGTYGTLIIQSDGSYIYSVDDSLETTNSLVTEDASYGKDRFVYTTRDENGNTHQSTLTVFVDGTDEIQTPGHALFTDYTRVDSVSSPGSTAPLDFTVETQQQGEKITEIRITGTSGATFNIPSILSDNGTITGNTEDSWELVWQATPGANAGLDSFDAAAAGLTLASVGGGDSSAQTMGVHATVSEYTDEGTLAQSLPITTAINITILAINTTREGTAGDDTITGTDSIVERDGSFVWEGTDALIGGAGNDTLTGGSMGSDLFIWRSQDVGTSETPAVDTITDFASGRGGDVLDLRDLLPDNASENLDEYLAFSFNNEGDTTIGISLSAGGPVVQNIVLEGVDLSALRGTTDVSTLTNWLSDNGNLLG